MNYLLNKNIIQQNVQNALREDIGSGDITAQLIAEHKQAKATIISREHAVVCGIPWASEVFLQVDKNIICRWLVNDGQTVVAQQPLAQLNGPARSLLTAERTALNFLQLLSGTATITHCYAEQLKGSNSQLLDTRKTIPGLRLAQKYAVYCGGGNSHRWGLYDAFLIKENHIAAGGSIAAAIAQARQNHPDKTIEIEVEDLNELQQAIVAKAHRILLDNFTVAQIETAVAMNQQQALLEVSGSINLANIAKIAQTGVDYISVGNLTKHVQAIDLSMRFVE